MMQFVLAFLAVLSIWEYPERQPAHESLRQRLVVAMRSDDDAQMERLCRKGVELLPEDPTWRYNLACSLARQNKANDALDALETAIDLGFRDPSHIAKDKDFAKIAASSRFLELVEYARQMKTRPLLTGPFAAVKATGVSGQSVVLGAQNLAWNFVSGCFDAKLELAISSATGNTGDLYMNRDRMHSCLKVAEFPGLTSVRFDTDARDHNVDFSAPNMTLPYPVFGNCSMAITEPRFWRSLPRALMTVEAKRMKSMWWFYRNNQIWVYPSNWDTPPVGTNGDVFASIAPYWIVTAGRSFSDLPYLKAALEVSRSLRPDVKRDIVMRRLLAPTITTLIRKSLRSVSGEDGYLTENAHPTAFPPNAIDVNRLVTLSAAMTTSSVPPVVDVVVKGVRAEEQGDVPELVYATANAWSFVLRTAAEERVFFVGAKGAEEFAFVQTHGSAGSVRIERLGTDGAKLTLRTSALSPTNRVDIAVVGRNRATGWGAPSYVSFSRMDATARYSDPALTIFPRSERK